MPLLRRRSSVAKLTIQGQKVNLYSCEHAKKERDINDDYVFSSDASCRFRAYSNTFLRWNKRSLSEYFKYVILAPPIRCEYIVGYGSDLVFTCKEFSEEGISESRSFWMIEEISLKNPF